MMTLLSEAPPTTHGPNAPSATVGCPSATQQVRCARVGYPRAPLAGVRAPAEPAREGALPERLRGRQRREAVGGFQGLPCGGRTGHCDTAGGVAVADEVCA
jgi:hypothetical protein